VIGDDLSAADRAPDQLTSVPEHEVTSLDSGTVFLIKALFYPVSTVALFVTCLWVGGSSLFGPNFLIALLSYVGVAEFMGASRLHRAASIGHELRWLVRIICTWAAIAAGIYLILYLTGLESALTDPAVLVWFGLTPVVLWSGNIALRQILYVGFERTHTRNAVIVGVTEEGLLLSKLMQQQQLARMNLLGFFEDRGAERVPQQQQHSLLGRVDDAATFVSQNAVNFVYITLPMSRHPRIMKLLRSLQDTIASVYFVPDFSALRHIQARVDVVLGVPMIAVCESPFFGVLSLAKRVSDIVMSGFILLCISPLMLAIAIGIKLTSPGDVIFRQRRYGLDGREMMVYKFRSMTVTEDGDGTYKQVTRSDSRVTRFGAFLRRTSMDELPQFFNVLEGSMSVVGPRPHAIAVNEHYRRLIPSYMFRHKVKPGLTGWAQVNGYRGGDDLDGMTKRIEFDLEYLENWSLWFDTRIILRTISLIWRDRNSY
jgi:putative colanic acid biosynthesis UDP-glucose lipid carrier transferase